MSQPEWDDLELDPADFPNENNFYNNTADFGKYQRPAWYLNNEIVFYPSKLINRLVIFLRSALPLPIKNIIKPLYYSLINRRNNFSRNVELIAAESRKLGKEWIINKNILNQYAPHANWLHRLLTDHEVIFAYASSPIYPMIYGKLPYISVEIGTMRDFPLNDSGMNKALWIAYKKSNHIIITNPDNRKRAEKQGIYNYSFCPHPLDEDLYSPSEFRTDSNFKKEIKLRHNADFIIFAPARQNWKIKGNDKYIKAFARLIASGTRATLLVPAWGQEIDRSKKLCFKLGIESRVKWLAPMSERMLVKYYQASDVILDQFNLGVFGLITPKAMSCGVPVLTSYDRHLNQWCFPEAPPVLSCNSEEDIYNSLSQMVNSPDDKIQIGKKSREWILKHHSKDIVRKKLIDAMVKAKNNYVKRKPLEK